MTYDPKYISLDDVPVQIPDDFSEKEKRDAIETAEASLESKINEGSKIPASDYMSIMNVALKQKATCELAKGSEHPDDVSLGDIDDTGSTKVDYAHEAFCDEYDELVNDILNSEAWEGESSLDPYVYNTGC